MLKLAIVIGNCSSVPRFIFPFACVFSFLFICAIFAIFFANDYLKMFHLEILGFLSPLSVDDLAHVLV